MADHIHQAMPWLTIHYVMDNALLPYGLLSPERLIARVNLVVKKALETIDDVKLLVIACNTASTLVLESLRQWLPFPVVGVVPAIKPAAEYCGQNGLCGLLATPVTVSNPYTHQLAERFAKQVDIYMYPSVRLVALAEKKFWLEQDVSEDVADELSLLGVRSDLLALVLGCTHFPLLADEIQRVLPDVRLMDSGKAIANRVLNLLDGKVMEQKTKGRIHYYASAPVLSNRLVINQLELQVTA